MLELPWGKGCITENGTPAGQVCRWAGAGGGQVLEERGALQPPQLPRGPIQTLGVCGPWDTPQLGSEVRGKESHIFMLKELFVNYLKFKRPDTLHFYFLNLALQPGALASLYWATETPGIPLHIQPLPSLKRTSPLNQAPSLHPLPQPPAGGAELKSDHSKPRCDGPLGSYLAQSPSPAHCQLGHEPSPL